MSDKKKSFLERKGKAGRLPFSKRPKMASWRPLNRFEIDTPDLEQASTSARKLAQKDFEGVELQEGFGYRIVFYFCVAVKIF